MVQQSLVCKGVNVIEASRSHSDTPQSLGLLWKSDQSEAKPVPENAQHSQETDAPAAGGIRTRNPNKRGGSDRRFKLNLQ